MTHYALNTSSAGHVDLYNFYERLTAKQLRTKVRRYGRHWDWFQVFQQRGSDLVPLSNVEQDELINNG